MFIRIGKVVDAHGLKGEVKVRFISEEPEWIDDLFSIYLHLNESEKTLESFYQESEYEVTHIRSTNQLWILGLDDVSDRTQAESLKNKYVFVHQDFFKTSQGDDPYLLELKGYRVKVSGEVRGRIISFLETPAHSLILLENADGEFEIPWVEDFINEIHREDKIIEMSFPLDLLAQDYNVKK